MLRIIAVFVGVAWLFGCASAPVQEMSDARQAIGAARSAGATAANSADLYAAQAAIARAEQHLKAQEYTRARLAAMQAKRHAGAALVAIQHADSANAQGNGPGNVQAPGSPAAATAAPR